MMLLVDSQFLTSIGQPIVWNCCTHTHTSHISTQCYRYWRCCTAKQT